ncbi:MAG: hypothetical protein AB1591_06985 [Pseudomonadota bacterium]
MFRINRLVGISKLEAMVALLLIAILGAILLDRLLFYQEVAERTAMETTIINLRSALRLTVAELRMQNRMQDLEHLVGANPIAWLDRPPANYAGELDNPSPTAIPPGSWCFDRTRRQLVYRPKLTRLIKADSEEEKLIRFQVTAVMRAEESAATPIAEGVALSLVRPYDWSVE